ncbi:alpha/beta hydrolase [Thalassobacillus hwangdonensis]|uniref:Alpha/beta hydrolase n=1 Tax=Thalassobacillus hwangdonensis TaxID=546108 RepID=A0ABW3L3C9_9BACI
MKITEVQSPFINETFLSENIYEIDAHGTPLIEIVEDDIFVHFLYFGDEATTSVHVLGSFPGWDLQEGEMIKVEGKQVWVKSYKTDSPFASTYYFSVNDNFAEDDWGSRFEHLITDPRNPNKLVFSEVPTDKVTSEISYITVNEPLQSMELTNQNPNVYKEVFNSNVLNNQRNLWIYDPFKNSSTPKKLLIVFDGSQYTEAIPVPNMMDQLYEEGKIPPTVMVGVDSPNRFSELMGNEQFSGFLTEELLPWIRKNFHVSHHPEDVTLCGASLGGLTAFYSALNHPNYFGNVLCQSGSFNHKKLKDDQHWSVHFLESQPVAPVRIYMNAGRLEMQDLLSANSLTYEALRSKGFEVKYRLFNGGHDLLWWRETFLEGLEYLFCEG